MVYYIDFVWLFINCSLLIFFRGVYPPAEEYVNHVDKAHITLVEAFRNLQVDEEEPLENGEANHEVYNGCQLYFSWRFSFP